MNFVDKGFILRVSTKLKRGTQLYYGLLKVLREIYRLYIIKVCRCDYTIIQLYQYTIKINKSYPTSTPVIRMTDGALGSLSVGIATHSK